VHILARKTVPNGVNLPEEQPSFPNYPAESNQESRGKSGYVRTPEPEVMPQRFAVPNHIL
jgi:hypothetical protein